MSPLIVRPVSEAEYNGDAADGEYSIIAGSRRYNAAIENGLDTVPCNVIEADDFEAAVKSLKENEERKDLTDEEKMRSLRMQYEMIAPKDDSPPYECKDCDDEFEDLGRHVGKNDCDMISLGRVLNGDKRAQTPTQAYKVLADIHYPEKKQRNASMLIRNQVKAVDLPPVLRLLIKNPEQRSLEEKKKLRETGLSGSRDLSASTQGQSGISQAFKSIVQLYDSVEATDGIDADTAVTKAVGDLDFGSSQSNTVLKKELDNIRREFNEAVSGADTAEDIQREFWGVVNQRRDELRELQDEVGLDNIGQVKLTFEEQKYQRYHALAREQFREDNNSQLVKNGYQEWLEELARKHGW
jgi:hypothetical protein